MRCTTWEGGGRCYNLKQIFVLDFEFGLCLTFESVL